MSRHIRLAGVVCLACWILQGGLMAEPNLQTETSAPQAAAAEQACGIWIEPGEQLPGRNLVFHVRYSEQHPPGQTVAFECEIRSEELLENATARLAILDASDQIRHVGEIPLPIIPVGLSRCQFKWDPAGTTDGTYTAWFELLSQHDRQLMAAQELSLLAISDAQLVSDMGLAAERVSELVDFIQTLYEMDIRPPYAAMRAAIAQDSLAVCRGAHEAGDWRRAHLIVQYVLDTVRSVRYSLTLPDLMPELMAPVPNPSPAAVQIRDGSFQAASRPVFLFGGLLGADIAAAMDRLDRYHLNLGVFDLPPEQTLAGKQRRKDLRKDLDALFQQGRRRDIGLVMRLCPSSMDEWVLETVPELEGTGFARSPYDMTQPAFKRLLERHFKAVLPTLANADPVLAVCLLENPRFHMGGESVRQGFIRYVEGEYPDRYAVNRAWQSHMGDLQDIDIWWDYKKPAYQFDWQWYHLGLATDFLRSLDSQANRLAPEIPFFLGLSDTAFQEGESAQGIDRESLAEVFPLSGCIAEHSTQSILFGMQYPGEVATYTLMRSFAPDKPVINIENRFLVGNDRFTEYTYDYVHGLMWESAMAGLSATAIPIGSPMYRPQELGDIWHYPQCIEAYAAACLDLNRLAPIVAGFQHAPIDVGILWSLPSKIFDDGDPHLDSLLMAFEGVSWFGYKTGFITEQRCIEGKLEELEILVIGETPAVSDRAFRAMARYVNEGGVVIRVGNPMPYGPHREARQDMLDFTDHTIMMYTADLPTSFLHSMDSAFSMGVLFDIPRPINGFGFPLEAVKTRYLKQDGAEYLYVVNLRKEPVKVYLYGGSYTGRDLIHAQDVKFPRVMEPLRPMLVRLDAAPLVPAEDEHAVASSEMPEEKELGDQVLSVELRPVAP